jgi:hypothetical protein
MPDTGDPGLEIGAIASNGIHLYRPFCVLAKVPVDSNH